MKYIPELDGLRGIAILMVMVGHIFDLGSFQFIQLGRLGVDLFFVLSGFLITNILLNLKAKIADNQISLSKAFKLFYLRRTIRIFPLYYLTVLVLAFLQPIVRENIGYYLTYSTNLFQSFNNRVIWNNTAHFWSLCVEEQFYLFWPIIVLKLKNKQILHLCFGLVLTSLIYKIIGGIIDMPWLSLTRAPIGNFETLIGGSLLAVISNSTNNQFNFTKAKIAFTIIFFTIIQSIRLFDLENFKQNFLYVTFLDLSAAILFIFLINYCVTNKVNWLKNPILTYVGKISYGLYVLHLIVEFLLPFVLNQLRITVNYHNPILIFLSSFILASLSWYLFEKPINSLKARFSY